MSPREDAIRVGPLAAGEELAFVRAVSRHFHEDEPDDDLQRWLPVIEADRAVVARDGDAIVGNFVIRTGTLSLAGATSLPCAAITGVGVAQTHRRRGLLTRMMALGLEQAADRGEPVAALYASESPIYGRYGFGETAPSRRYEIDRASVRFADPVDRSLVEAATLDEALASWPDVLERGVRERRPGCLDRPAAYWRLWLAHEPAIERRGMSRRRLVHVPGRGYAAYRLKDETADALPAGRVLVEELVAADPEAEQALWQHVLDIDLTTTVEVWWRPADDALPHLVTDRLRLRASEAPPVHTCLLDVPAALVARRFHAAGTAVIEVVDRRGDRTTRYRLDAEPDGATCRTVTADPDVTLPLDALSAAWLGGLRVVELVAGRRAVEHRAGAAAALDRLLAVERLPWTPFLF